MQIASFTTLTSIQATAGIEEEADSH